MDDMNQQPFERQVKDVANRAVGPERHVEALAIARHAHEQSRRNRFAPLFGAMKFAMGAAVVALFGAVLIMSGVFENDTDSTVPGTSPSTSPGTDGEARPAADKVIQSTGRVGESVIDLEADGMWSLMDQWHGEMETALDEANVDLPFAYPVTASDPRLEGEAIVLIASQELIDTLTVDDADDPRPTWELERLIGRMRITNDEGTWEGRIGPNLDAAGEEPIDDVPGNAPVLSSIVPAVLQGDGAYRGLTAYLWFSGGAPDPDPAGV